MVDPRVEVIYNCSTLGTTGDDKEKMMPKQQTWVQRERAELSMLRDPVRTGERNMFVRRCRYYRLGRPFQNRRMSRMHAESNRGVECGLGLAFRVRESRR